MRGFWRKRPFGEGSGRPGEVSVGVVRVLRLAAAMVTILDMMGYIHIKGEKQGLVAFR